VIEEDVDRELNIPDPGAESPERFDPDVHGGKLVHSEHLARYLWASQLARGRAVLDAGCGVGYGAEVLASAGAGKVVAVDIGPTAVAASQKRLGGAAQVTQADVRDLPFDDDAFDLIVSFELIEHIEEPELAIKEFARTLRPDGYLLISSPNPQAYPKGNPHHVREFSLGELRGLLKRDFGHVAVGRQYAWIGSLIATEAEAPGLHTDGGGVGSHWLNERGHEPSHLVACAGHRGALLPPSQLVFGDPFELKWWTDQLKQARTLVHGARQQANDAKRELAMAQARFHVSEETLRSLERRLIALDQEHARTVSQFQLDLDTAIGRQRRAESVARDIQASVSWRVTAPIRATKQLARRLRFGRDRQPRP
jgi:2-polyprenyl-3-methyl-5-hydroxy-6-metoxy-1,4-benzoquinol methylase